MGGNLLGCWTDSSCSVLLRHGDYSYLIWLAATFRMTEISASLRASQSRQHLAHETPMSRLGPHINLLSLSDWKLVDPQLPAETPLSLPSSDVFAIFFSQEIVVALTRA